MTRVSLLERDKCPRHCRWTIVLCDTDADPSVSSKWNNRNQTEEYSVQIALLKLLLTSTPTAKAKTESINILCDVIPEEMPCSMVQTMKLGFDINRHKVRIGHLECSELRKAILFIGNDRESRVSDSFTASQTLESQSYLSSRERPHARSRTRDRSSPCFASSLNISAKISSFPIVSRWSWNSSIIIFSLTFKRRTRKIIFSPSIVIPVDRFSSSIAPLDFPACVIGPQPELTADLFDIPETENYCWRNMFSSINLLRILNKLTKGKHARTMVSVSLSLALFTDWSYDGRLYSTGFGRSEISTDTPQDSSRQTSHDATLCFEIVETTNTLLGSTVEKVEHDGHFCNLSTCTTSSQRRLGLRKR